MVGFRPRGHLARKVFLPKKTIMEEMERLTASIEGNGKKEIRVVGGVEFGGRDLPDLIPRLNQGKVWLRPSPAMGF